MTPEKWLDEAFGSVSRVRILRLLAREPARPWNQNQIARAIAMSPSTTNRAIRELDALGLLLHEHVGSTSVIRLRPGLAASSLLRQIFRTERQAWAMFRQAVARALSPGVACVIFGSAARGTATRGSDVDVLIVAASQAKADEAARRVQEAARSVLPMSLEIIALGRARARRRRNTPLFQSILAEGQSLGKTRLEDLL